MSLSSCLKKAGDAILAEDATAILERARVLRGEGVKATAAGKQAVDEQIAAVSKMLEEFTPKPVVPAAKSDIQDLGEKIGGARKDLAEPTGGRRPAATAEEDDEDIGPTGWRKAFVAAQNTLGRWFIKNSRKKYGAAIRGMEFATQAEAEAAIPLAAVAQKHRAVSIAGGKYELIRDVTDRKRVKIVDQEFDSREDAMRYMAQHAAEILDRKTGFREDVLAKPDKVRRTGPTVRAGDVDGKAFMDTFGFRGVEFGNWNNQAERQELMNHAYDGLLDLADVLNLPPKALSLHGDIGLAFGARGHGLQGARAHYERNYGVMNLTKMQGAGALAHEWFHALDHYLGRMDIPSRGKRVTNARGDVVYDTKGADDYASHGKALMNPGLRAELRAAYDDLMKAMFKKAEAYIADTERAAQFVETQRKSLGRALDLIRVDLSRAVEWKKVKNKPATPEQLAKFDAIAQRFMSGDGLATEWKNFPATGNARKRSMGSYRYTNDDLESLSALLKEVRGHSGFNAERHGTLDRLRAEMTAFAARAKMLADANDGTDKTRMVPTSYAMEAKRIDQGMAKDYWTTEHEMAARAFSAYVEDKLQASGRRSDFLSYGSDNRFYKIENIRPFPEGTEREELGKSFDKFFSEVKTEETDKGVKLYSRGDQTKTPAFKAWFGDSKVVDAKGEPLVVYHGTRGDVEAFDKGRIGGRFPMSRGIYATTSRERASIYADSVQNAADGWRAESRFGRPVQLGANVMPVYVSIKNPKVITGRFTASEDVLDADMGEVVRQAENDGYDGVIVRNERGDDYSEVTVVAFNPEQIKSAIGNRGTFDRANPSILMSRGITDDQSQAIISLYGDGKTQAQIGAEVGVSQATVGNILRRNGIAMRQYKPAPNPAAGTSPEQSSEIADLYSDGQSYRQIISEMRVSASTITRALVEAGIQARPKIGADGYVHPEAFDKALKDEAVRLYVDEEMSASQVAKRLGISGPSVVRAVSAAGVTRTPSERMVLRSLTSPMSDFYGISVPWQSRKDGSWHFAHSSYEMARMLQLDSDPAVASYTKSVQRVPLPDGRIYIPDIEVHYFDGRVEVEEIKADWAREESGVLEKADAATEFFGKQGIEFKIVGPSEMGLAAFENLKAQELESIPEATRDKIRASADATLRILASKGSQKLFRARGADGAFKEGAPTATKVRNWLGKAIDEVKGAVNVKIHENVNQLRIALNDPDIPENVEGVYITGGDTVHLVADQLPDRETAIRKFVHETFGHLAMERYGDMRAAIEMTQRLLAAKSSKVVNDIAAEVDKLQPNLSRRDRAKEVIAMMAERGVRNSIIDKMIAGVRELLRKMGVRLQYTETELRALIARAARALRSASQTGKPADEFTGDDRQFSEMPGAALYSIASRTSGRAYDWASKYFSWYGAFKNLPDQDVYRIERMLTQGTIERGEKLVRAVYETFSKATLQVQQQTYHYLTNAGAAPGSISEPAVRARAIEVKELFNEMGREYVRRGMLSQETIDANKDSYLPRMYLKHLLGEKSITGLGTGKRVSDLGNLKERKDIDRITREIVLGEIKDPAFLAAAGLSRTIRDMALLDLLETVSKKSGWVLPQTLATWNGRKVSALWLKQEAERLRVQSTYMQPTPAAAAIKMAEDMEFAASVQSIAKGDSIRNYREVPDSPRYGMLRGVMVRKEIYDDLIGAFSIMPDSPDTAQRLIAGLTTASRVFKWMKVVASPQAQVRNGISNTIMLNISGVPMWRIPAYYTRAIQEMQKGGAYATIAEKYGLMSATFSAQELARINTEWTDLQKRLAAQQQHSSSKYAAETAMQIVKELGKKLEDLYGAVEAIGKLTKLMHAIEVEGLSESQAALESNKWLFDYSAVPSSVRRLRNLPLGAPFLSYTYFVLPRIAEAAAKHPLRILPWLMLPTVLTAMTAALFHVERDDIERLENAQPGWMLEAGSNVILPFKDAEGRWQAMDLQYTMPWGGWRAAAMKTGKGEPLAALTGLSFGGGPVSGLLDVAHNYDSFRKKEIYDQGVPGVESGDSIATRLGKSALYLANTMNTPLLTPSGPIAQLWDAAHPTDTGSKMPDASIRTPWQSIASAVGMKISPYIPESIRAQTIGQMKRGESEYLSRMRREMAKPKYDAEDRADMLRTAQAEIKRRRQLMMDYEEGSRIAPELATKQVAPK